MTSRGPVVEGEVDDVTVAFLEAEVDDVTAAAVEAEVDDVSLSRAPVSKLSQSCLLSKVVGAPSPPLADFWTLVARSFLGLTVGLTI